MPKLYDPAAEGLLDQNTDYDPSRDQRQDLSDGNLARDGIEQDYRPDAAAADSDIMDLLGSDFNQERNAINKALKHTKEDIDRETTWLSSERAEADKALDRLRVREFGELSAQYEAARDYVFDRRDESQRVLQLIENQLLEQGHEMGPQRRENLLREMERIVIAQAESERDVVANWSKAKKAHTDLLTRGDIGARVDADNYVSNAKESYEAHIAAEQRAGFDRIRDLRRIEFRPPEPTPEPEPVTQPAAEAPSQDTQPEVTPIPAPTEYKDIKAAIEQTVTADKERIKEATSWLSSERAAADKILQQKKVGLYTAAEQQMEQRRDVVIAERDYTDQTLASMQQSYVSHRREMSRSERQDLVDRIERLAQQSHQAEVKAVNDWSRAIKDRSDAQTAGDLLGRISADSQVSNAIKPYNTRLAEKGQALEENLQQLQLSVDSQLVMNPEGPAVFAIGGFGGGAANIFGPEGENFEISSMLIEQLSQDLGGVSHAEVVNHMRGKQFESDIRAAAERGAPLVFAAHSMGNNSFLEEVVPMLERLENDPTIPPLNVTFVRLDPTYDGYLFKHQAQKVLPEIIDNVITVNGRGPFEGKDILDQHKGRQDQYVSNYSVANSHMSMAESNVGSIISEEIRQIHARNSPDVLRGAYAANIDRKRKDESLTEVS